METSRILIPKADVFKMRNAEEAIQFDDFLREETNNREILELKKQIWEIIRKSNDDVNKRYNTFYGTLLKCWKVYANEEHVAYIYPYMLNETNKCLFCLYSPTDHINNYYIPNGLYEKTLNITEWYVNTDIIFVECTIEEMLENGKAMCEKVLERRLRKIEEKGKECAL